MGSPGLKEEKGRVCEGSRWGSPEPLQCPWGRLVCGTPAPCLTTSFPGPVFNSTPWELPSL